VQALLRTAESMGQPLKVLDAVEKANDAQKLILLEKVRKEFGNNLIGKHFALWGLAFKPNTDDMREATSKVIIRGLLDMGATITAYDPVAMGESKRVFGDVAELNYAASPLQALNRADALLIITEWKEFRAISLSDVKNALNTPYVFDGRNIFSKSKAEDAGLKYFSIGRDGAAESMGKSI